MSNSIHRTKWISALLSLAIVAACVKDRNFDPPESSCIIENIANTTYAEVKALYTDETIQIHEDLVIEAYVISSDRAGNFFNVLHFQDKPVNPTEGFQIEIDIRDTHLFYPVGSKIYIKLKGLYLGKSKDVFKIGGVFTSFGNVSVGRLPAAVVAQHILRSCDEKTTIQPVQVAIDSLEEKLTNTLVQFNTIEIIEEELGLPFAIEGEETERSLVNCNDDKLTLLNSGYSDFQSELLPNKNGNIVGVLTRDKEKYRLAIRSLEDINFNRERCEEVIDEFTSNTIFISELADPDNTIGARFVELYNSSNTPLPLKGWKLHRYTNGNTEISSTIDLSPLNIEAESTIVISPNATEFELIYGFTPDISASTNSPADSNGDDNLVLVDPFGKVIDIFGIIGEDGSGTNHEFEDGRAVRNSDITTGNATYTFTEWTIYNDSGDSGTINQPQNAPDDFTPGERN